MKTFISNIYFLHHGISLHQQTKKMPPLVNSSPASPLTSETAEVFADIFQISFSFVHLADSVSQHQTLIGIIDYFPWICQEGDRLYIKISPFGLLWEIEPIPCWGSDWKLNRISVSVAVVRRLPVSPCSCCLVINPLLFWSDCPFRLWDEFTGEHLYKQNYFFQR